MSGALITVEAISRMLNDQALAYAAQLLPNGYRDGPHWKTSSIDDVKTGRYSLVVNLSGAQIGHWRDFGGCRAGEDRGDVLDLIRLKRCGGDMKAAIEWAKADLGLTDGDRSAFERRRAEAEKRASARQLQAEEDRARYRRNAQRLYLSAVPLTGDEGAPARLYLAARGIDLVALGKAPGALRFNRQVYNSETGAKLPAMVASIVGLDGAFLAAHRTWLAHSAGVPDGQQPNRAVVWRKASLVEPKMTLGSALGGHIPLWKGRHPGPLHAIPEGTPVYVSEGIEDGLSIAMAMPDERVIACVSLSKLGSLALPPQMGPLIVIGQRDPYGSPAIDSLERGIGQLQAAGRTVRTIYPPAPYKDFNEWLQRDPEGALGRPSERKAG